MKRDENYLVLGGAGLVGAQIVREIARELEPQRVVVASLYRGEVREILHDLRREFPRIEFVGAWGDVFVRETLRLDKRRRLLQSRTRRQELYDDLYSGLDDAYDRSGLVQLIEQHRPDVIVDSINTATAISYQDVYSLGQHTADQLAELQRMIDKEDMGAIQALSRDLESLVSTLLISQSMPQLIRHVQLIHSAMMRVGTRLYLKIGTTGTGGMGLNIPYTHSEDKPSKTLMTKTAVAFAHTGLLFLMARTPGGPLVKEIKPAAMIGYRRVSYRTIKQRGKPQFRYQSTAQTLGDTLVVRGDENVYERVGRLQMPIVDTGENGHFARGEFEAITHIDQMEMVTPEEIGQQAVLEIKGSNTGYDIIAGVDSSVMNPSYRGGVLRQTALDKLARMEKETGTPSVAIGQLGPPELSKLLFEAHLLKVCFGAVDAVLEADPRAIADAAWALLENNHELRTTITSIGLPILLPDGGSLLRGPRINIPESIYHEVPIEEGDLDRWAQKGWVDLRPANFAVWKQRFVSVRRTRHVLHTRGTSSITRDVYIPDTIEIGAIVAWIFNNEEKGYRIK